MSRPWRAIHENDCKGWKRRNLIRDRSTQTEQRGIGFQTRGIEPQGNLNSTTNVQMPAYIGVRRQAWDVESQVNPYPQMDVQAGMGFRTDACKFKSQVDLNSTTYVEVTEQIELSAETRRPSQTYMNSVQNADVVEVEWSKLSVKTRRWSMGSSQN